MRRSRRLSQSTPVKEDPLLTPSKRKPTGNDECDTPSLKSLLSASVAIPEQLVDLNSTPTTRRRLRSTSYDSDASITEEPSDSQVKSRKGIRRPYRTRRGSGSDTEPEDDNIKKNNQFVKLETIIASDDEDDCTIIEPATEIIPIEEEVQSKHAEVDFIEIDTSESDTEEVVPVQIAEPVEDETDQTSPEHVNGVIKNLDDIPALILAAPSKPAEVDLIEINISESDTEEPSAVPVQIAEPVEDATYETAPEHVNWVMKNLDDIPAPILAVTSDEDAKDVNKNGTTLCKRLPSKDSVKLLEMYRKKRAESSTKPALSIPFRNHLIAHMKMKSGLKSSTESVSAAAFDLEDAVVAVAPVVSDKNISSALQTDQEYEGYFSNTSDGSVFKLRDSSDKDMMKKSVLKGDIESCSPAPKLHSSSFAERRKRKERAAETAGPGWFHMPRAEMTDDLKKDLQVMKMRSVLDGKQHYKRADSRKLPRFVQRGVVVEGAHDFFASRTVRKQRKRTIVDELLADAEFRRKNKRKYLELQAIRMKGGRRFKKKKNKQTE